MALPLATAALMTGVFGALADRRHEVCAILYLGAGRRLTGSRHIAGSVGGIDVSVRTIIADALTFGARAVVMAHNHPSGDAEPSSRDIAFTHALCRGLDAVGVVLRDHIILAPGAATSLRARGIV